VRSRVCDRGRKERKRSLGKAWMQERDRLGVPQDVAVAEHHPLGWPGGARGVDDGGELAAVLDLIDRRSGCPGSHWATAVAANGPAWSPAPGPGRAPAGATVSAIGASSASCCPAPTAGAAPPHPPGRGARFPAGRWCRAGPSPGRGRGRRGRRGPTRGSCASAGPLGPPAPAPPGAGPPASVRPPRPSPPAGLDPLLGRRVVLDIGDAARGAADPLQKSPPSVLACSAGIRSARLVIA
jgi:hypothetical protein